MKRGSRTTIYINADLERLLLSGAPAGRSTSTRLAVMASRYEQLIAHAFPRRLELTAPELLLLADQVADYPIDQPDHALSLAGKLQQLADQGARTQGVDASSLSYRLRNCKLAEVLALVDLCERYISQSKERTRESATEFLNSIFGR
jgi:hypothetical protein